MRAVTPPSFVNRFRASCGSAPQRGRLSAHSVLPLGFIERAPEPRARGAIFDSCFALFVGHAVCKESDPELRRLRRSI